MRSGIAMAAERSAPAMSIIVDAHPHLVAADTKRYPITPLGGRQSEWSKGLHLTAEELLVASGQRTGVCVSP